MKGQLPTPEHAFSIHSHKLHVKNITLRHLNSAEIRLVARPPHDLVETVVDEMEQRLERIAALKRQPRLELLVLVVVHERLRRQQVLERLRQSGDAAGRRRLVWSRHRDEAV